MTADEVGTKVALEMNERWKAGKTGPKPYSVFQDLLVDLCPAECEALAQMSDADRGTWVLAAQASFMSKTLRTRTQKPGATS